jgi:hypothetical protein
LEPNHQLLPMVRAQLESDKFIKSYLKQMHSTINNDLTYLKQLLNRVQQTPVVGKSEESDWDAQGEQGGAYYYY